ncbi:MAG: hypothetical protein BGO49_31195 [Planctomycetales bacterium 71-10]|nr:MAG: hypothetical protein BGO49_31195 [Planctomycetales bacterium 71-10]
MKARDPDVVSASEIASWAWCPESWRLSSLGHEPSDRDALAAGERRHEEMAAFEQSSRSATSFGRGLVVAAALLALAAVALSLARG